MEGDSPVEAENQEGEVVADAYARAQGDVVEETLEGELGSGAGFVLTHQPYVARIEEDRAVQVSAEHVRKEAEAVFEVRFELDVARLVHIRISRVVGWVKTSRTYGAHRKGTDAVRPAHVELLAIRRNGLVAVRWAKGVPKNFFSFSLKLLPNAA